MPDAFDLIERLPSVREYRALREAVGWGDLGFVSRRAGRSRQLTEDITQETYLRAVAQWRSGRRPENALAWLRTVARNLLLNHYSRKSPESLEASSVECVLETEPVDDPEAAALVYWGLARLGRRPRRLLEAFYIEGKRSRHPRRDTWH